ncbi:class I SAM-dependent methyltransferase [Pullulanibacillus sp. KACC 23026]|uniref:class I SAM-dependent methyltransferase n=1 Tax=Pullulanibacillus sp. KACC 23026 TaxID=3028315 RepID=UPI0023AF1646|nr:class I SAM-dependent methyltransferase [Pullulanibacillus sp. KACC 23026]WEG11702.1 class I SAM-dependent methyltransferase [Pullulanibacillus sp. KACC 23026]
MNRIEYIRSAEKDYHDYCYDNYRLFEKGSWLNKPVKMVMDQLQLFAENESLSVLDLGSGVGRNSIPIAQHIKKGKVVCVDLLNSAIDKLKQYSNEFGVSGLIQTVRSDIADYTIQKEDFNYIVAVSSLEHLDSEETFEKVVQQMAKGTKVNGINCIIVNSNLTETLLESNEKLEALMEINLTTEEMLTKLHDLYGDGWEVINELVKPLDYQIVRNEKPVLLSTDAITFVVRKTRSI